MLCGELSASGSGSLHGGPRAAKCAVSLLIQLGRASVAARLFLEHRATLLRSNTKSQSLHAEGALTLYVKRVCGVFFRSVVQYMMANRLSRIDSILFHTTSNQYSVSSCLSKMKLDYDILYFSHMAETGRQFQKAFIPHSTAIASGEFILCILLI